MTQKSILIVDDSEPMRRMLRACLSDLAAEINECIAGAELLSAYAAQRPDWVVMEVAMRGIDGLIVLRRLLAEWPEARVVIVTNYDDETLREEALRAGACDYILKENLLEVRRLLAATQPGTTKGDCPTGQSMSKSTQTDLR